MAERFANALSGKRVAITRAAEQSQPLLAALREQGAQPILLPMVAFAPPDDLPALDDSLRHMREYHWVFFTSQNAVRALQERSEHLKISLRDAVADRANRRRRSRHRGSSAGRGPRRQPTSPRNTMA